MTTLTALQEAMTACLKEQGIEALSAWPKTPRRQLSAPLAVVAVEEVEGESAGFGAYLGQVLPQGWEAQGQRLRVRFALDLCSPPQRGEEGCRALLDQVIQASRRAGPGGLRVERWVMGKTQFQEDLGLFCGRLRLECQGLLLEEETEDGAFLGFEVKGGVTI